MADVQFVPKLKSSLGCFYHRDRSGVLQGHAEFQAVDCFAVTPAKAGAHSPPNMDSAPAAGLLPAGTSFAGVTFVPRNDDNLLYFECDDRKATGTVFSA